MEHSASELLLANYKFALLCENDNAKFWEEEIKKYHIAAAENEIEKIKTTAENLQPLLKKAFDIGVKGGGKESSAFQDLLFEAQSINDYLLIKAVNSCHDRGLFEYVPEANSDHGKDENIIDAIFSNSLTTEPENNTRAETEELKQKILRFRSWINDAGKQHELQEAVARIKEIAPEQFAVAQKMLENGKVINQLCSEAFAAGKTNDVSVLKNLKKQAYKAGASNDEIGRMHMNFNKGKKSAERWRKDHREKIDIEQKFNIPHYDQNTKHPFFIGNLSAESHWRIFVDETGHIFDKSAFDKTTKKQVKGKFVALFVPDDTSLPSLGPHHATDQSVKCNLQVLEKLFTHGENCGILGVTLDGMAQLDLDYWFAGLERLLDISIRLIPKGQEPVKLDFYIENRGAIEDVDKTAAAIQRSADAALLRYGKSFPEEAAKLTIKIHCIAKTQTKDSIFLAFNGYVDTVACAWFGGRKEMKQAIKQSGLIHRCLMEGDILELPLAMDRIRKGEMLPVNVWNSLLTSPDRQTVDSLVNSLLADWGFLLRENVSLWEILVNEVVIHLDSKAINISRLTEQVKFLMANMPAEINIPKRLQIIWLTSRLASENHAGQIREQLANQLVAAVSEMFLEDAPLCCAAMLHIAVKETNAFRFESAKQFLLNFSNKFALLPGYPVFDNLFDSCGNIAPDWTAKVAVPGLRYYGQLLSSLGQHEAFLNNFEAADDYFRSAIQCFSLLNDGGKADIMQTMSYLVINLMDHTADPLTIQKDMETYLDMDLDDAAAHFAVSTSPAEKYQHHILLRYLILLPKDHSAVKIYMSKEAQWKRDAGHPWEMIDFYRALLCDDREKRKELLKNAYNETYSAGPTLRIISAVLLGAIRCNDDSVAEIMKKLCEIIVKELPALGEEGKNALLQQISSPIEPQLLAKKVLPFNFR